MVLPAAYGAISLTMAFAVTYFSRCRVYECCDVGTEINWNHDLFISNLSNVLYGQPLVNDLLPRAIRGHFLDKNPEKPLAISFHGWTGSGKTFTSTLVASNLFKKGVKSSFYNHIACTKNFPDPSKIAEYKQDLTKLIESKLDACPYQLFVFDEIDKMPVGLFDILQSFLDYSTNAKYNRAIYIFLSNTGGREISRLTFKRYLEGKTRESIQMKDIEPLLKHGSFNDFGGLRHSNVIEQALIDHYVPFLPLEREHVKLCLKDVLRRKFPNDEYHLDDALCDKIVDEQEFAPPENALYAKNGCKTLAKKVDVLI